MCLTERMLKFVLSAGLFLHSTLKRQWMGAVNSFFSKTVKAEGREVLYAEREVQRQFLYRTDTVV